MSIVISAENLGKKYLLNHRSSPESYQALRDLISDGTRRLCRRLAHPLRCVTPPDRAQEEFWALQGVSFDVKQGDRIGIIGRNGAGKSTLLKILSRITEPSHGSVRLKGRVASLLEVGTGFHPELSGRENIYLNGAILGMPRAEIRRKFDEIVDFAEVERFLDTPVKHYSSGMYVRLAFAVAAHLEPEILVVDEVLAVGDAHFQRKCLGKMEAVGKEGRTVLLVSHNMGAITRLCQRAILLSGGKVVRQGEVADVVPFYLEEARAQSGPVALFPLVAERPQQVTRISVHHQDGTPLERPLTVYEPLLVRLGYRLNQPLPGAFAALLVRNQAGEVVLFSDSRDCPESARFEEAGDVSVSITLPAPLLAPGRYSISATIARPPLGTVDGRDDAVWVEIEDTSGVRQSRAGHIYQPLKWQGLM